MKKSNFYGRKALAFDDEPGKKAVRLYDLFTGKDLWKKDLGVDGWQLQSQDDAFAGYVTTTGDVVVLNATDGKEVFKGKLDEAKKGKHLEKINEAMLFSDNERFFVMLNRPNEGQNRFGGYQPVFTQAIQSVKVNGNMYAFERSTGKRLWYTDEQLEDSNISIEMFDDLPLILAASMYQKFAANGQFEGQFTKFLALDKATGKLKYYKQVGQQAQYYSIVADPKAGTIDVLNYSGQRVRFVPDDGKSVGAKDGGPGSTVGSTTTPVPAPPAGVALPVRIKR